MTKRILTTAELFGGALLVERLEDGEVVATRVTEDGDVEDLGRCSAERWDAFVAALAAEPTADTQNLEPWLARVIKDGGADAPALIARHWRFSLTETARQARRERDVLWIEVLGELCLDSRLLEQIVVRFNARRPDPPAVVPRPAPAGAGEALQAGGTEDREAIVTALCRLRAAMVGVNGQPPAWWEPDARAFLSALDLAGYRVTAEPGPRLATEDVTA